MGVLEVDGIYLDRRSLWEDCNKYSPNTVGPNGGVWAHALTTTPDTTLSGLYKQVTDTIRDMLLRCKNGDSWAQLGEFQTTLASLEGQETRRLNQIHREAQRYGVAWQWPAAFPVQGI